MKLETLAVHAGAEPDAGTSALAPPIHLSTTFRHGPAAEREGGHEYGRESNPTQDRLEAALAALEGGREALTFASGMAAIATLLTSLPRGAHVLVPEDVYAGTRTFAAELLPEHGITAEPVDVTRAEAVRAAMTERTRLVWVETPSNPQLRIADLEALAHVAHERGALLACDSTFATPVLQRPLALGADVVMHSTTKYIGGHHDVMGGALVFARRDELSARARQRRHLGGAVLAPFAAWLTLRGLRSLPARMAWHCRSAQQVAAFLAEHPGIELVHYPGLPGDPGHAVARRQMSDFGGVLSIRVRGGRDGALRLASRVKLFVNATSLGGFESLIEHRASVEGAAPRSPESLLRLSIGLEHPDDLLADLAAALAP